MDKKDLQVLIGSNLQRCRDKANLTQEQVAERVGISTSFYANLERGNRSMSIPVLLAVADVLHVSANTLLYSDDSKTRITNICNLLNGKPESLLITAEGILYALIEGFPIHQEDERT